MRRRPSPDPIGSKLSPEEPDPKLEVEKNSTAVPPRRRATPTGAAIAGQQAGFRPELRGHHPHATGRSQPAPPLARTPLTPRPRHREAGSTADLAAGNADGPDPARSDAQRRGAEDGANTRRQAAPRRRNQEQEGGRHPAPTRRAGAAVAEVDAAARSQGSRSSTTGGAALGSAGARAARPQRGRRAGRRRGGPSLPHRRAARAARERPRLRRPARGLSPAESSGGGEGGCSLGGGVWRRRD